jgi:predicted lipid-binding transport protein (Tim44 family)
MNQVFDPFNIIILAVAVIIFFRLRSVLGTRTGSEKPFDPFAGQPEETALDQTSSDNVVPLPGRNKPAPSNQAQPMLDEDDEEERKPIWQGYAKKGSAVARGVEKLAESDDRFTPKDFLSGAKMAYEMIVTAFTEGDKSTLKPLLSKEVFDGFAGAIDERKKLKHTLESRFVGINKAEIQKIDILGDQAQISIRFVSDLITATMDDEGTVIDGNPTEIQEITDVWTFERPTGSKDPNWRLIATEAD